MRNLQFTLTLCLLLFAHELLAKNTETEVVCSSLEGQPDMVACAGKGNGIPAGGPEQELTDKESSYLHSAVHIVGRLGNGFEFFFRIFKVGQKVSHLCTGQYQELTGWTIKTLLYNTIETCDHASEFLDVSVRHYISSTLNQASQQLGTLAYYVTGAIRFSYLSVASATDLVEFSIEKGRSTRQTIMNGFLAYITLQNLGMMVYEALSTQPESELEEEL